MPKLFGTTSNPQLTPFSWTETIHDDGGDSVSVTVNLARIDDGSGFSTVNEDSSNVDWLSFSILNSSTPMDVTNVEMELTADPADLEIGYTYRLELTADDGTDSLTVIRDIEVLRELPIRTAGLTPDATWDDPNTDFEDLSPSSVATVRAQVDIASGDSGVIMEAGAGGNGLALWTDGATLYFACGNGSGTGSSSDRAWITTSMPTGTDIDIEWSASANSDTAALYVHGDLQGTDSFNTDELAGTNLGGISQEHGNGIRDLVGGIDTSSLYDGTVDFAEIFIGTATSDV